MFDLCYGFWVDHLKLYIGYIILIDIIIIITDLSFLCILADMA